MRLLYNLLQIICFPVFLAALPVVLLRRPERGRLLLARLGRGLPRIARNGSRSPVIWTHALSVGEVTSALPLIKALRADIPDAVLVFSASTASGISLAERKAAQLIDHLVAFPLDVVPVVTYFLKRIQPDLFILVETDFWPNLLAAFSKRDIPSLLVNGRISEASRRSYRRFSWFFRPMFDDFDRLLMQTRSDSCFLSELGIGEHKLQTLGNLKYATERYRPASSGMRHLAVKPPGHLLILCGSTHRGEEIIILEAYRRLAAQLNHICLAIAPRHIARSTEIELLAQENGLSSRRFSGSRPEPADVLIIDTIGDLSALYEQADIAFIGGSLVDAGGHNPIEAAHYGIPVLFGPHMDDFSEISRELLDCRAAFTVENGTELEALLLELLDSAELRSSTGSQARLCVSRRQDIIAAHLGVIRSCL